MVNTGLLKEKIQDKGIKFKYLADKMKIGINTFAEKMNGRSQFNAEQMKILRDELGLSFDEVNTILFADNFAKMANSKKETA